MIKRVLYKLLSNSTDITSGLSTYQFGTGADAKAAIFTMSEIPEDAELPAIHITFVGGSNFGTNGQKGADFHVDVALYGDRDITGKPLEELAMTIWDVCNRANLDSLLGDEGYTCWGCRADPPRNQEGLSGFPGYLVTVHVRALKEP